MLDTVISKVTKCPSHVMRPFICHMKRFDRVMKYPLHRWLCRYTSSMCKHFLFQDWMTPQVSPLLPSTLRGGETIWVWHQLSVEVKPFECHIISPLWGNRSSVTLIHVVLWGHYLSVTSAPRGGDTIRVWQQLSVVGKPFEYHIISPLWRNRSSVISVHVAETAVECHISPHHNLCHKSEKKFWYDVY